MIDGTASCTVEHCTNHGIYTSTLGYCDGKYYCEEHTPYYCIICQRNKAYVDGYYFNPYIRSVNVKDHGTQEHPYNKYIEYGMYSVRCICKQCIDTDRGYIEYCSICGHYYTYQYAQDDVGRYHGCEDVKCAVDE